MFDYITGTCVSVSDSRAVIECGGIGYLMTCSYNTILHIKDVKENVRVYTYMSVKDTGIELMGFYSLEERDMFNALTSVNKVGSRIALSILSMFTPSEIAGFIVSADSASLSKASGVGKKLAESIVFNLKDRFKGAEMPSSADSYGVEADYMEDASHKDEALIALTGLGFERSVAIRLINDVFREGMGVSEIIAEALRSVGGN
ncbi:MAG: Holliday junction branch migration protein RuvA [Eubacteriaceae bacterium]|nr:Holliday junction branch migration protein RuvA [Eubacteriaceae bacterium]